MLFKKCCYFYPNNFKFCVKKKNIYIYTYYIYIYIYTYTYVYIYIYIIYILYIYIYILYIYIHILDTKRIHHWRIFWSSYRKAGLSGIWINDHLIPFRRSNRLSHQAMSSNRREPAFYSYSNLIIFINLIGYSYFFEVINFLFEQSKVTVNQKEGKDGPENRTQINKWCIFLWKCSDMKKYVGLSFSF